MELSTIEDRTKSETFRWTTRLLWVAIASFALYLIIAAIPHRFAMLETDIYGYGPVATSYRWFAVYFTAIEVIAGISLLVVASVIAWRKAGDWLAFLVATTLAYIGVLLPLADGLIFADEGWLGIVVALRLLVYSGLIAMLCLFPNGRFAPRWTRWLLPAWIVFVVSTRRLMVETLSDAAIIPNTRTLQDGLVLLLLSGWIGIGVMAQLIRYRHFSTAEERQQTKWVLYGLLLVFVVGMVNAILLTAFTGLRQNAASNFAYVLIGGTMILLSVICLAIMIAFAVFRYRLWDIDFVINRGLVYGSLTAITVGIYVIMVGGVGSLLEAQGGAAIAFVATGVVAVLFQPLRIRLQRGVDRLMYGQRDDPVGMLTHLARRLEAVDRPESILPTLVETIATALKLPYVALWLPERETQWEPAAVYGKQSDELQMIPLLHQKQEVGRLFVAPRGPGERFSREDERLLVTIAQLSATTVQAAQLSLELQQSRRQLVSGREEERRRLRRDLHDGLGPLLAAVTLQADTARDLVDSDPEETRTILESIMNQAQAAVADVRRLVYDLRPPTLDELGLVGAVRQSAQAYQHQLPIHFAAVDLPPLPAAVEVAAYRIVQEAINNVVKHAGAQNCTVTIDLEDGLRLSITDDGQGLAEEIGAGVGIVSMKERAAELGGVCTIQRLPGGGTQVQALLPLTAEGQT